MVSVLTYAQIRWGYQTAGLPTVKYDSFLSRLRIDIAPLVQEDAAFAARKKPKRDDLVNALIAATVIRYEAVIWTKDRDFLEFLPKEKVSVM
jgi:predicted nucleic acid-binding protein